jgi:hypothetical protein
VRLVAPQRPNPFRKFTKLYDLEERRLAIEMDHPERASEFAGIRRSQETLRRGLRDNEALSSSWAAPRFERTLDEFGGN